MKAPFSSYLNEMREGLAALRDLLLSEYSYVSILSTDSCGYRMRYSQHAKSIQMDTMMTERGNVIRVYRDGLYSEYAFNDFDPAHPERIAEAVRAQFARQQRLLEDTGISVFETAQLRDDPAQLCVEMETEHLPETDDLERQMEALQGWADRGMQEGQNLVNCMATLQSTHVSKMFLTRNRDLRQSYVYSEGNILAISNLDGRTDVAYSSLAGRCGSELAEGFEDALREVIRISGDLQRSERVEPGEYTIIASPEISGLIAHEAFGHGVEMDMFVKERALGAQYLGKRVGSDLVTMHEGANCELNVASYAFDDEGTLAGDVVEIDRGILKTGICDALSALRLGIEPTGNGKRENFEHKVYTRMTNTMFDSGSSTLEEMIASVDHGYLLEGIQSGMEDPKHWGIQCIIDRGYEIRDGKLTGAVVSPVILTGYVPELLGSITMASTDRVSFGSGGCGKGHKEWVKVSDGGPYLKAKARLG